MKIVLIQTPWSDSSAKEFKGAAKKYACYPPIGLLYLTSFLEKNGQDVLVFDLEIFPLSDAELVSQIQAFGPDLIGFTSTSPVFAVVQSYAIMLRKHFDEPFVLGGPHVSAVGKPALTPEFDYAIMNEGELTLLDLMRALQDKQPLSTVDGLIYRDPATQEAVSNQRRKFIEDLDSMPFPAREKIDPQAYCFEVPGKGMIPVATTELTRGCPFQCVFCSEPINTGKRLRRRSPENVIEEIRHVQKLHNIHHFFFLDSTLTVNRKLIENLCHAMIEADLKITFEGQTRANLIDEELMTLMKKAGLIRLSFGVESADATVLKLMKKRITTPDIRAAFALCEKLNVSTLCGVMMGNPGDNWRTVLKTAFFVRSIPQIRYAPMAIAIPYPGTELEIIARQGLHGLKLLERDYNEYSRWSGGVMTVAGMRPGTLVWLQRLALLIMHSTPSKMRGLIEHFGFFPLLSVVLSILRKEVLGLVWPAREKALAPHFARNNTTLINMRDPIG